MEKVAAGHPADRLEGSAPAIQALRAQIRHLASFDAVGGPSVPTLLLQGETGTGKGLVARIVHDSGPRARGAFVPVNCASRPETLPALAEHAAAGGDWLRALGFYREAGLQLLARDANREAARCLEQAIAVLARR